MYMYIRSTCSCKEKRRSFPECFIIKQKFISKDELASFMQKILEECILLRKLFLNLFLPHFLKNGKLKNDAETQNARATNTIQTCILYIFMQNNDHFGAHTCTSMQAQRTHWGLFVFLPLLFISYFHFLSFE